MTTDEYTCPTCEGTGSVKEHLTDKSYRLHPCPVPGCPHREGTLQERRDMRLEEIRERDAKLAQKDKEGELRNLDWSHEDVLYAMDVCSEGMDAVIRLGDALSMGTYVSESHREAVAEAKAGLHWISKSMGVLGDVVAWIGNEERFEEDVFGAVKLKSSSPLEPVSSTLKPNPVWTMSPPPEPAISPEIASESLVEALATLPIATLADSLSKLDDVDLLRVFNAAKDILIMREARKS